MGRSLVTQYWSDLEILCVTTGEETLPDGDTLPGGLEVGVPCRDTCGPHGKCMGGLGCSSCARTLAPTSVTRERWLGPARSKEHQQHLHGREVDTLLTMCREPVLMWSRLVGAGAGGSGHGAWFALGKPHGIACSRSKVLYQHLPSISEETSAAAAGLLSHTAGLQLEPALGVSFDLCELHTAKHMSKSLLPPGRHRAVSQSTLFPWHLTFSAKSAFI